MEKSPEEVNTELEAGQKHYSEEKLWTKLKRNGKKAGAAVIYTALLLYFTLQNPEVPAKTKATIIGALGYFILPLDLIPDIAAGFGFTDDLGVLGIALLQAAMYINEDIKAKAKAKLAEWFGSNVDTSEIDKKI